MAFLFGFLVFIAFSLFVRFAELKISADLEARVGPQLSGASGILQPLVDWIRKWFKINARIGRTEPRSWWALHWILLVGASALAPGVEKWWAPEQPFSVFGCFCLLLLARLTLFGVGLRQESLERWLGVTRRAAMVWTASAVLLLSIIWVNLVVEGLSWSGVSSAGVLIFEQPMAWLMIVPTFVSVMMLTGTHPFSSSMSAEIGGGERAGLVGVQTLREDVAALWAKMIWGMWLAGIFFGGNDLPQGIVRWAEAHDSPSIPPLLALIWALSRAGFLLIALSILGRVSAALRSDHSTDLAWKWLFPCGLFGVGMTLLIQWVTQ